MPPPTKPQKFGVSVDCVVKTIFDKSLGNLKDSIIKQIEDAVADTDVLEVQDTPKKGFSVTATLTLTKDDKAKPPQIEATITLAVLAVGVGAGTINSKKSAKADAGSNPKSMASQAEAAVDAILTDLVPKTINAMVAKAKASP
jgi:hypothetical protein